ncbi:uncharacterized protein BDW70DRAFT_82473 [Aspergillus foveolatus]|uniref:uncharacterized protein n=1 Tax=Aspergillus foveolatus TaxID=210207 RepID=UPI003CCD3DC5
MARELLPRVRWASLGGNASADTSVARRGTSSTVRLRPSTSTVLGRGTSVGSRTRCMRHFCRCNSYHPKLSVDSR